jgi:hypothetical protein
MNHQSKKVGTPSRHGHAGHGHIGPVKVSQVRYF